MAQRKIIKIDESKCTGCGACIPNCPEGALKVVDGKVRLLSDLFCDGLGACIGHCPLGAITIEERDAEPYDERQVMANIVRQGPNVIREHLGHLKSHRQDEYFTQAMSYLKEKKISLNGLQGQEAHVHGRAQTAHHFADCPGSRVIDRTRERVHPEGGAQPTAVIPSELRQWPVQIMLVPPQAPYLKSADVLIAADCVPFAYADFHRDLLKGKALLVGCPKLDDVDYYRQRITDILKQNHIKSVTYAHMEVPCCSGLIGIIESAIAASGKKIPFKDVTIGISGEKLT